LYTCQSRFILQWRNDACGRSVFDSYAYAVCTHLEITSQYCVNGIGYLHTAIPNSHHLHLYVCPAKCHPACWDMFLYHHSHSIVHPPRLTEQDLLPHNPHAHYLCPTLAPYHQFYITLTIQPTPASYDLKRTLTNVHPFIIGKLKPILPSCSHTTPPLILPPQHESWQTPHCFVEEQAPQACPPLHHNSNP
jgi:hypothetical protein